MLLELVVVASLQTPQSAVRPPDNSYLLFVASEGFDQVALVRFDRGGARIEHRTAIQLPPNPTAAPREIRVAPRSGHYYIATGQGFPNGELLKFRIAADSAPVGRPADTLESREPLDAGAGAIQVTPDEEYAWVTGIAPGDDVVPGIAVVYLKAMTQVARIATCGGARGGKLTGDGSRHYSGCVQNDQLVEIDTRTMKVTRRLALSTAAQRCEPAAIAIVPGGSRLLVSCEGANEVVEVNVGAWSIARRMAVGAGPADLAVTPDGQMAAVTNVQGQSVSLLDLASGREKARVATVPAFPAIFPTPWTDRFVVVSAAAEWARRALRPRVPGGVTVSPDSRYLFVSVSGPGTETGSVDVIDVALGAVVATVEVGRGARGIDFWKQVARKNPN